MRKKYYTKVIISDLQRAFHGEISLLYEDLMKPDPAVKHLTAKRKTLLNLRRDV